MVRLETVPFLLQSMPLSIQSRFSVSAPISVFLTGLILAPLAVPLAATAALQTAHEDTSATLEASAIVHIANGTASLSRAGEPQTMTLTQQQLLAAALRAANQVEPESQRVFYLVDVAEAAVALGDVNTSRDLLEMLEPAAMGEVYRTAQIAEMYAGIGDLDKAKDLLQQAMTWVDREEEPDQQISSLRTILSAYASLDDEETVAQGLSKILESLPDGAVPSRTYAYFLRAVAEVYGQMQTAERARLGLNDLSQLSADHIAIIQSGQLTEDVVEAAPAEDLADPTKTDSLINASLTHYVELLTGLSAAYRQQGEFATAEESLALALALNQTVPEAYLPYTGGTSKNLRRLLAIAHESTQLGDTARSQRLIAVAEVVAIDNENPYSVLRNYGNVAKAYYQNGDIEEAQNALANASSAWQNIFESSDKINQQRAAYLMLEELSDAYAKVDDIDTQQQLLRENADGLLGIIERVASRDLPSLVSASQASLDSYNQDVFRRIMQTYPELTALDTDSERFQTLERLANTILSEHKQVDGFAKLSQAASNQGDGETAVRLAQEALQLFATQTHQQQFQNIRYITVAFGNLSDDEAAYAGLQSIHQIVDDMPRASDRSRDYPHLVRAYLSAL